MGAGAPKGNKNASKWDTDSAKELFKKVLDKTKEKAEYIVAGNKVEGYLCHYLGEAADEAETNTDTLKYLSRAYGLKDEYEALKSKCERNCFSDAKKGIINTAIAIVNLKSNHNWTDRVQENKEVTHKGKVNINFNGKRGE